MSRILSVEIRLGKRDDAPVNAQDWATWVELTRSGPQALRRCALIGRSAHIG
ncbi:hypothetical protein ABT214_16880 [Micromonospora purpureochromogenes]|uniref:hypothetical protein n=1 Tax=Micromonospora purpureochromogenes TaxID=47872 RepID=UPI00331AEDD9